MDDWDNRDKGIRMLCFGRPCLEAILFVLSRDLVVFRWWWTRMLLSTRDSEGGHEYNGI
jgi:hypothetical protein